MLFVESDLNKFRKNIKCFYIIGWIPYIILIWTNTIFVAFHSPEYLLIFLITIISGSFLLASTSCIYFQSLHYLDRESLNASNKKD